MVPSYRFPLAPKQLIQNLAVPEHVEENIYHKPKQACPLNSKSKVTAGVFLSSTDSGAPRHSDPDSAKKKNATSVSKHLGEPFESALTVIGGQSE